MVVGNQIDSLLLYKLVSNKAGSHWGRGNRGDIRMLNRMRYGINTWNRQELHRKLDGKYNRRPNKRRKSKRKKSGKFWEID